MPHVALVAFTGFRIREPEMLELGMALPGLQARAGAIAQLPALGLLTLAALNPPEWTASYHDSSKTVRLIIERKNAMNRSLAFFLNRLVRRGKARAIGSRARRYLCMCLVPAMRNERMGVWHGHDARIGRQ
jgi:hypothetical protein